MNFCLRQRISSGSEPGSPIGNYRREFDGGLERVLFSGRFRFAASLCEKVLAVPAGVGDREFEEGGSVE